MDFNTHVLVLPCNLFFNRAKPQLAPKLLSPCQKQSVHISPRAGGSFELLQSSHKVPNSPTYGPGFPSLTSGEADDKCIILFWWILKIESLLFCSLVLIFLYLRFALLIFLCQGAFQALYFVYKHFSKLTANYIKCQCLHALGQNVTKSMQIAFFVKR